MEINKEQLRAVNHNEGPMMVLAGPGSGKTLVITRRTFELIETFGVRPENILVITFTKAAAQEMKERFCRLYGGREVGVNFGTFHAVFFKILKYAYNYNASNILRDEERNKFLREIVRANFTPENEGELIEAVGGEISRVKNERIDLMHYYSMSCPEQDFRKIFIQYEKCLRDANKIDFDDMLGMCYELLTERSDILLFWQKRYRYILIDEFQDINSLQYDIIRLLALPENNLFIVGDDDQSIYRFRGAKPEIMLGFEKDYPNCLRVTLCKNYRSTRAIVQGATNLIVCNLHRFSKNISAQREGDPIRVLEYATQRDENEGIARMVLDEVKRGGRLSDIAVLYRTNLQPRALTERLMEYNIPFYIKDKTPCIYDHWIAQNIFDYIDIACGKSGRSAILHIINRPKRYIGRDCFSSDTISLESLYRYYEDKPYVIERIEKLEYDLSIIKQLSPSAAVKYIRRAVGYDDFLKEYAEYRGIDSKELFETADEFLETSVGFDSFESWYEHIEEYRAKLRTMDAQRGRAGEDCLQLMTFHGAKGLEYGTVYILDANEEVTPHERAVLPEDMEEERRMFYVAVTRARERAYILYAKKRYSRDAAPSRFIGEMLDGKRKRFATNERLLR